MTAQPMSVEHRIDRRRPNLARVTNYLLDGDANTRIDRDLGDRLIAREPKVIELARSNRSFLHRVVTDLLERGITQFLDIGAGLPTAGTVHEITRRLAPEARVAYVDHDPATIEHGTNLLARGSRISETTTITYADLRRPNEVLAAPGVSELLDLTRPVAVLMLGVLQQCSDDDGVAEALHGYGEVLPADSGLAISHPTTDDAVIDYRAIAELLHSHRMPVSLLPRTRDDLHGLMLRAGTVLDSPGVVDVRHWRTDEPGEPPGTIGLYGVTARFG